MIYTADLGEKLERQLAVAKEHKIPMLLDDAAGIRPADNARLYARMKIDLYAFSGGKGLCGPQCNGFLLGRKDLIEAALMELRSTRRLGLPPHESWKGRNRRMRDRLGDLAEPG